MSKRSLRVPIVISVLVVVLSVTVFWDVQLHIVEATIAEESGPASTPGELGALGI